MPQPIISVVYLATLLGCTGCVSKDYVQNALQQSRLEIVTAMDEQVSPLLEETASLRNDMLELNKKILSVEAQSSDIQAQLLQNLALEKAQLQARLRYVQNAIAAISPSAQLSPPPPAVMEQVPQQTESTSP